MEWSFQSLPKSEEGDHSASGPSASVVGQDMGFLTEQEK